MAYTLSDLNFNVDINKANYETDAIQKDVIDLYLRIDADFRRAFYTNFTTSFIQYLKDKARLREPIRVSIKGVVRGGKSYSAISICIIHSLLNGHIFNKDYICANAQEFADKLKIMPKEDLINHIFLIDEQKMATFGTGSFAKKAKLEDLENIIAINNISTISITPQGIANESAHYLLKCLGKDYITRSVRFMLYDLQDDVNKMRPLGLIYIPIFSHLLPLEDAQILEKDYSELKNAWVDLERSGKGDILGELKRKTAEQFLKDNQFMRLTKKVDKLTYIRQKLGSEWTNGETEEINNICSLLISGVNLS